MVAAFVKYKRSRTSFRLSRRPRGILHIVAVRGTFSCCISSRKGRCNCSCSLSIGLTSCLSYSLRLVVTGDRRRVIGLLVRNGNSLVTCELPGSIVSANRLALISDHDFRSRPILIRQQRGGHVGSRISLVNGAI